MPKAHAGRRGRPWGVLPNPFTFIWALGPPPKTFGSLYEHDERARYVRMTIPMLTNRILARRE